MTRSQIGWTVLIAMGAAVLGAGSMYYLSGLVMSYGNAARFIADASTDIEILERLSRNDLPAATSVLAVRLRGSLLALQVDRESLTDEQRSTLGKLEERGRVFLPDELPQAPAEK